MMSIRRELLKILLGKDFLRLAKRINDELDRGAAERRNYANNSRLLLEGIETINKSFADRCVEVNTIHEKLSTQVNENARLLDDMQQMRVEVNTIHEKLSTQANENTTLLLKTINESFSVQEINSRTFAKYRNIHRGKTLVVIGTGPTLNHFIPIENAVNIGVNSAVLYDKLKLDYLFIQDINPLNYINSINKEIVKNYPCKKFFSFQGSMPWNLPVKYRGFPDVEEYCRTWYDPYRITVCYDICKGPLSDFASVIFPAFQFALWTYPSKIYIVGCDCDYGKGHFHGLGQIKHDPAQYDVEGYILYGWRKMKEFWQIYYPDVEIISINPVGLKGLFKDEYTESFLKTNSRDES